jgi:hypothetical protein
MIDHPGRINIAEFPAVFEAFGASNACDNLMKM